MKRILSLCLLLGLFLMNVPGGFAGEKLPEAEHMELSYQELTSLEYDHDAFTSLCREIIDLAEKEERELLSEQLSLLSRQYKFLETKKEIAAIAGYQNTRDEAISEAYLQYMEMYYDADEWLRDVVRAVMDSSCWDLPELEDAVFLPYLYDDAGGYSQDELDLIYAEQALVDQYYSALSQEFSVEVEGVTYTQTELDMAWAESGISYDLYDEVATMLAMEQNDALAWMYLDLVENRKAQAALYDYTDPSVYYDLWYYNRDVTAGERNALCRAVKTYIVPLMGVLEDRVYADEDYEDKVFSQEELILNLEQTLARISPEFSDAVNYMTEFGYYDIEDGAYKTEGAMTTYLSYPNAPFLLMQPTDTSYDFTTLVHEFGHYNAFYCSPDPMAYNMDLAEIHSQALELLMLSQYEMIFGESSETEELYTLYSILMSLVDGCMFDELERYAYQEPELTVEKMNRKYMELLKEYGYRDEEDKADQAYGWVGTGHLFGYPLYYFSYAVSGAAALEIWEMSRNDYENATEIYLELVALGEGLSYFDALNRVGMDSPLTNDHIQSMAQALTDAYGLEPSAERGTGTALAVQVILVLGGAALFWIVIILMVIIIVKKKEKKRDEAYRQYIYSRTAGLPGQGGGGHRGGGDTPEAAGPEPWRRGSCASDDLTGTDDPAVCAAEEYEAAGFERGGSGDPG